MQRFRVSETSGSVTLDNNVIEGPNWAYGMSSSMRPINGSTSFPAGCWEAILDVDHGMGKFNPCIHVRQITQLNLGSNPVTVRFRLSPTSPELDVYKADKLQRWATSTGEQMPSFRNGSYAVPTESDIRGYGHVPDFSGEALQVMWPEVESRLSFLNSVYELKDFKKLIPLATQSFNSIQSLLGVLSGYVKNAKGKTLKQLVQAIASNHLNYMFNVSPLISDISSIRAAMHETHREVERLLANADKNWVSHYRKSLSASDLGLTVTSLDDAPYDNSSHAHCHKSTFEVEGDAVYTATMQYTYGYSRFVREHAHALGMLDALGIQLNPAVIWNGIKLSFLVDWLLKVSNWLNQFRALNLRPQVVIDGFCHSVKFQVKERNYMFAHQALVEYDDENPSSLRKIFRLAGSIGSERQTSYYVRLPIVPNVYTAIQTSGLSTTEISLGLSLLTGFIKK